MEVCTLRHVRGSGWSVGELPALDSPSTLVVVFGAPAYAEDLGPLSEIAAAFPTSVVIGCSSAGEIHGRTVSDGSLSVAIARFERTRLAVASFPVGPGTTCEDAGELLGRALAGPELRAAFVLSDGIAVNGTSLLHGMQRVLDDGIAVSGGLAGDGTHFKRTWVLVNGKPVGEHVVGVGFYGDAVSVSHGSRGGWDPFGPERLVTRSEGNVLYELDGEPALSLYKNYLGERAAGLPATALLFPLALRTAENTGQTVVRTILAVDEASQSMTFAGDIPVDATVQLMRANFDRLIEGAAIASRVAGSIPPASPALSIAISCVGRRLVLGERAEEEVEAAAEGIRDGQALVGFYSYGEISPLAPGRCGALHNQTMTLTRIWEG